MGLRRRAGHRQGLLRPARRGSLVRQLLHRSLAADTAPLRPTLAQSPILNEAQAELRALAEELKEIDPPAFEGYLGFIWAEFLERWLW
jgi:hypothetical protein